MLNPQEECLLLLFFKAKTEEKKNMFSFDQVKISFAHFGGIKKCKKHLNLKFSFGRLFFQVETYNCKLFKNILFYGLSDFLKIKTLLIFWNWKHKLIPDRNAYIVKCRLYNFENCKKC